MARLEGIPSFLEVHHIFNDQTRSIPCPNQAECACVGLELGRCEYMVGRSNPSQPSKMIDN